jgi:hypothetical protein
MSFELGMRNSAMRFGVGSDEPKDKRQKYRQLPANLLTFFHTQPQPSKSAFRHTAITCRENPSTTTIARWHDPHGAGMGRLRAFV